MEYDTYGKAENPPLLLLHGAAATDTFSNQYCFADRFYLIVPHLAGSGRAIHEVYDPETTLSALETLVEECCARLHCKAMMVMGHSLGGELAVALVSRRPQRFSRAVFLSAWVCATQKSVREYGKMASMTSRMLHWRWLVRLQARYWHYTPAQTDFMVEYAAYITPRQYAAWFVNRIYLDKLPRYASLELPMLAICGSAEVPEMKASLAALGARNPHCETRILQGASHDFPMRCAKQLNPMLLEFLTAAAPQG